MRINKELKMIDIRSQLQVARRKARELTDILKMLESDLDEYNTEEHKEKNNKITNNIKHDRERTLCITLKQVLEELEKKEGKIIAINNVVEMTKTKGYNEEEIMNGIEMLKRSGDCFEPRRRYLSRL